MKCFRPITWSQESLTPHLFLRCFGNLCKVERFCNEVHRHYTVSIRAPNTHLLNPSGIGFSEPVIGTMAGGSPHYSQASCYVCCCKAGNQNSYQSSIVISISIGTNVKFQTWFVPVPWA